MQRFEFIQADVDELTAKVEETKRNSTDMLGVNVTFNITIRRGSFSYTMGIIYAALLVEYMQEQLDAGNIVDVALYTTQEWEAMEEELQDS